MKRILAVIAAVLAAANLSAQPKAVIFDTDWWTDVDEACAIRILHSAHKDDLLRKVLILHHDFNGRDAWDPMTVYMACLGSPGERLFDNQIEGGEITVT